MSQQALCASDRLPQGNVLLSLMCMFVLCAANKGGAHAQLICMFVLYACTVRVLTGPVRVQTGPRLQAKGGACACSR